MARPYVDVHAHIGDTVNRTPPVGQSIEKYLGRMAQSDIVAAVPSTAGGGPRERGLLDIAAQNDATAGACRAYPDRFPIGLALVEVRYGPAAAAEIERAMDRGGLQGLMCHPGMSSHALDAVLHPALEVVDARGGLALIHVGGKGSEAQAAAYARRFRRMTFIFAHVSMNEAQHRDSIAAFAGLEHVWTDFAQHPATADRSWDLADLVCGLGAGRLLFGSDSPYYDYRLLQRLIEAAPLDEATKERIAWRNAVELIRRFQPAWQVPTAPPAVPPAFAGADLWAWQPGKVARLQ